MPEDLFEGPAVILHRDFEGDWVKQPLGTGAFLLNLSYLVRKRFSHIHVALEDISEL